MCGALKYTHMHVQCAGFVYIMGHSVIIIRKECHSYMSRNDSPMCALSVCHFGAPDCYTQFTTCGESTPPTHLASSSPSDDGGSVEAELPHPCSRIPHEQVPQPGRPRHGKLPRLVQRRRPRRWRRRRVGRGSRGSHQLMPSLGRSISGQGGGMRRMWGELALRWH